MVPSFFSPAKKKLAFVKKEMLLLGVTATNVLAYFIERKILAKQRKELCVE